jgi:hypothetical protein
MTTGFLLFLAVISLAASAPVILAAAVGCLFFSFAARATRSIVRFGLVGAVVGAVWWLLANLAAVWPGYMPWSEGTTLCAAGFSLGAIIGLLVSVGSRRALIKVSLVGLAFLLANVLALLSVLIERSGPEQLSYGNMCGPTASDPCYQPALKGGFPLAYLTDVPGVSVEHKLFIGQDDLRVEALAFDIAFYFAAILFVVWIASRGSRLTRCTRRRPTASPGPDV